MPPRGWNIRRSSPQAGRHGSSAYGPSTNIIAACTGLSTEPSLQTRHSRRRYYSRANELVDGSVSGSYAHGAGPSTSSPKTLEVSSHRRIGIPFPQAARGKCRFCGQPIIRDGKPNKRFNWHPDCVDSYMMQFSSHARERVRNRDRGKCASCGRRSRTWEHDHIVPLKDGGSHALENMQTLCVPCHKPIQHVRRP